MPKLCFPYNPCLPLIPLAGRSPWHFHDAINHFSCPLYWCQFISMMFSGTYPTLTFLSQHTTSWCWQVVKTTPTHPTAALSRWMSCLSSFRTDPPTWRAVLWVCLGEPGSRKLYSHLSQLGCHKSSSMNTRFSALWLEFGLSKLHRCAIYRIIIKPECDM